MDISFVFAQVGGSCTPPNPFEWVAIIALISGSGVLSIVTGAAAFSIGSTIVSMIISGASIATITAAISGDAIASAGGADLLGYLIAGIIKILGC